MVRLSPVQGKPALLISSKEKTLCIADLHLGYEVELQQMGFNLPDQTDSILKSIMSINEGDRLLILGDLKHTIAFATRLEYFGLSRFFKSLAERYSQIDVIAGNHDGGLQKHIPSDVNYHGSSGIAIDKVGLTHGHSWPSQGVMKSNKIVFAHIHPSVRLTDRMGTGNSVKVWLRGKVHRDRLLKRYPKISVEESIIMPAFNHLITGSPVNENKNPVSNPLMKSGFVNISDNHAYTLEGIDLGAVAALLKEKTRNVR